MSAPAPPFSRSEATPQSIQKLLDENAQLIRAMVENMNIKGKSMECIQYQQTLHRNLIYLASLADPGYDLSGVIPPPQRIPMSQAQVTTISGPYSMAPPSSMTPPVPSTHQQRQPQATTSNMQWSSSQAQAMSTSMGSMRHHQPPPPGPIPGQPLDPIPGQYPSSMSGVKSYGGSMWVGQAGQMGPYGMQQPGIGPMSIAQEERRRQILRLQQEQLIQAQQMRRMQQQGQSPSMGPAPMYPPPPPPPPAPGMIPGMVPAGMPPGYAQTTSMSSLPPHTMPHGPMNM